MSSELIQTIIVSVVAAGAAGRLIWRLAVQPLRKRAATPQCGRCAVNKRATTPAGDQLIQIVRKPL